MRKFARAAFALTLAALPIAAHAQGNGVDGSGSERKSNGGIAMPADLRFVETATKTSLAVLTAGQIAAQKGSPPVQAAASRLVADHSALNAQVRALAIQKGYSLPADTMGLPDSSLVGATGPNFDNTYLASEIFQHEQAIAAYRDEASNGLDMDFRAFAQQALPRLEDNLRLVRSAAAR